MGQTLFRQDKRIFGIQHADLLHHLFIIGKTGVGKTTLMKFMLEQHIKNGQGCALLDPHGDMVGELVQSMSADQRKRLVYMNIPDPKLELGYNPLAFVSAERRPLLASGIMEIVKKQFDGRSWGVRMEHLLRNALLTLLEQPEASFADILRLFTDNAYRSKAITNVQNQHVRNFWLKEYAKYSYRLKAEAVIPVQNKFGGFLSNPTLARILTENENRIRLRSIMDNNQILLINLAKGQVGDDAANLLGGLFLTSLGLAAYSRNDIAEHKRQNFFIYVDEFHNFSTSSTTSMMAELRKYHVGLITSTQYLHQLDRDIREAVIGNAGSLVSFRVGSKDAKYLSDEFDRVFSPSDLIRLHNTEFYIKMLINHEVTAPFSAQTLLNSG